MTPDTQPQQAQQDAPVSAPGTEFPSLIEGHPADLFGQQGRTVSVGQHNGRAGEVDPTQLTPQELDEHIATLGRLMVRAHRLGDRETARRLLECQVQARAARSPQHVARQDAEHLRRVVEGVGFFSSDAAQAIGRRAAEGRW